MTFLTPFLKGREPGMIDPHTALELHRKAADLSMVDKLVQMVADRPAPAKSGKIAVIPLMGVIGMNLSPLQKALGGVDLMDFRKMWKAAEADPNVSEIWSLVDSPGGSAAGVEETARMVRNTVKPTASYNMMAASAGYYISAAHDRVLAPPSATIGSIGVRMVVEDWSKAYENAGVKVICITSGDLKGGTAATPITEAEIQDMIAYAEELGAQFRSDVLLTRPNVPADAMRGQSFTARKAATLGLVTGLYDTLEEALASSKSYHA
jgi:ClpP class serine protease